MNLDESQKQQLRSWIQAGMQPADIQTKLSEVFGVSATYMEVKFLLDDLDLKPQDQAPEPDPASALVEKAGAGELGTGTEATQDTTGSEDSGAGVSIWVDQVTRAGAVVSGGVRFRDGKGAKWYLDQMGRLGLAPDEAGYKPGQQDLMEFQVALQDELARHGM